MAANYRAARRAKSAAHFLSKLGDVEEEADETLFWLELLEESEIVPTKRLSALKKEADELVAIIVASINTAKGVEVRMEFVTEFRSAGPGSSFPLPTSA